MPTIREHKTVPGGPSSKPIAQSGVIPYRLRNGRLEVALVTASGGPHGTIPKGHVEPDMSPQASAAKEAYEESGLIGQVGTRRLGHFVYEKRGRLRRVDIFALLVHRELRRWPEMLVRKRRWMTAEEAASLVKSAQLRCCIKQFSRAVRRRERIESAA